MESGPKRTSFERERDLVAEARLYLQGRTQQEIAEAITRDQLYTITRQQVGHDLKIIQRRWREASVRDFDDAKAQELARIDALEREYWSAWEASKAPQLTTTVERSAPVQDNIEKMLDGGDAGEVEGPLVPGEEFVPGKRQSPWAKRTIKREVRVGDPRYLDGVMKCIQERCRILGLEAPTRIGIGQDPGAKPLEIDAGAELLSRLASIASRAGAGAGDTEPVT